MNFITWLEAKLNTDILRPTKYNDRLRYNHVLKLDKNGNVVPLEEEDFNTRTPNFEIQPRAKLISLHRISPQSIDFRKIILALKSYYNDVYTWDVVVHIQAGHMNTGNGKYYRTVGYWMNKENDVSQGNPKFFYHGTSTNVWYSSIKLKGLMPRELSGSAGSYGAQNVTSLSRPDMVYLSTHPDAAAREAAIQAANKHGGNPMIIKVDSNQIFKEKLMPDEDAQQALTAKHSIRLMSTVAYKGRIAPSALTPILIGEKKETKTRITWVWEKFYDVPEQEHPLTNKLRNNQIPYDGIEYYALKDAGILKKVETTDSHGHRNYHYVISKSVTDKEIKDLLKSSGWAQTARQIRRDLDNGYNGNIYKFKNAIINNVNEDQEKVMQMLFKSKLINKQGEYFYLNDWDAEDKIIDLAKQIYKSKMSYEKFIDIVKSIKVE